MLTGVVAHLATVPAPPEPEGKDIGDWLVGAIGWIGDALDHVPKAAEDIAYLVALAAVFTLFLAIVRRARSRSLVVRTFTDGAVEPKIGAGVAALVEERLIGSLRRKERSGGGYDLDRVITDVELLSKDDDLAKAMGRLGDVSQLQLVVGVLELVERLAPSRGLAAAGELLPAGESGAGIALALFAGNTLTARSSLWEKDVETWLPPDGDSAKKSGEQSEEIPPEKPISSAYYRLASPAAWWVQYEAARAFSDGAAHITDSAPSFALVGLGLAHERKDERKDAAEAYASALSHDPDNIAALINLARMLSRCYEAYCPAALLLIRAGNVLARRSSEDGQ